MAWGWRKAIPTQLQETSRHIIYQETVRFRCCCGSQDLKGLGLFVSHSSSSHQHPSQLVAEGFRCPNQLLPWCCRSCRGTCVLLAPGPAADGWGGAGGGWLNCFYFSISHSMCFMCFFFTLGMVIQLRRFSLYLQISIVWEATWNTVASCEYFAVVGSIPKTRCKFHSHKDHLTILKFETWWENSMEPRSLWEKDRFPQHRLRQHTDQMVSDQLPALPRCHVTAVPSLVARRSLAIRWRCQCKKRMAQFCHLPKMKCEEYSLGASAKWRMMCGLGGWAVDDLMQRTGVRCQTTTELEFGVPSRPKRELLAICLVQQIWRWTAMSEPRRIHHPSSSITHHHHHMSWTCPWSLQVVVGFTTRTRYPCSFPCQLRLGWTDLEVGQVAAWLVTAKAHRSKRYPGFHKFAINRMFGMFDKFCRLRILLFDGLRLTILTLELKSFIKYWFSFHHFPICVG